MSVSNSTTGEEAADEGVADLLLQEEDTGVVELGIPLIPVDLFVRKRKKKKLTFTDTFNNVVFQATAGLHSDRRRGRFLLDSSGRPIIFVLPDPGGSWRAFRGNSGANEDLLFTVERSLNTFSRIELNVLNGEQNREDSAAAFKVKGSVFWRSFCIYREDSILAQVYFGSTDNGRVQSSLEDSDEIVSLPALSALEITLNFLFCFTSFQIPNVGKLQFIHLDISFNPISVDSPIISSLIQFWHNIQLRVSLPIVIARFVNAE